MVSLTVHATIVASKNPSKKLCTRLIKKSFKVYEKNIENDGLLDLLRLGIKCVSSILSGDENDSHGTSSTMIKVI